MDRFDIICESRGDLTLGRTYVREGETLAPRSLFLLPRKPHWTTWSAYLILSEIGCSADPRRAREFADLLDGDLDGFNYLHAASQKGFGPEAMRWVMGGLAAALNDRKLPFSQAARVLPPDYLNAFAEALTIGSFERAFAKDIFAALLDAPRYHEVFGCGWVEEVPGVCGGEAVFRGSRLTVAHVCGMIDNGEPWQSILEDYPYLTLYALIEAQAFVIAREEMGWWETRRISGSDALAAIIADPRFQAAGDDAIDALILEVIAANPDNAAKVVDQPKLVQWFVGQTMKAAKAKGIAAIAPTIMEKLNEHFHKGAA